MLPGRRVASKWTGDFNACFTLVRIDKQHGAHWLRPILSNESGIRTRLLVSARSAEEALAVLENGAHWLDLKEPTNGSLGAPSQETLDEVLKLLADHKPRDSAPNFSIAGGELSDWNQLTSLELLNLLPKFGFIKIALSHCAGHDWGQRITEMSHAFDSPNQLILVHYADADSCDAPTWREVIDNATQLNTSHVLIDTFNKECGTLLSHYSLNQLASCIHEAHERKLSIALAGSIRLDQLSMLARLNPDWIGVRGAVCDDDRTGQLNPTLVKRAVSELSLCSQ